jgi:hypothetical protein
MTGPEDHSGTRPISVAELLAKNGTIGAPPVGGRRRRRRGGDGVTVAELTGEIPIVTEDSLDDESVRADATVTDQHPVITAHRAPGRTNGAAERVATPDPEVTEAEDDYEAHLAARDSEPAPLKFKPKPRRTSPAQPQRRRPPGGSGAEDMSPDPFVDDEFDRPVELVDSHHAAFLDEPRADDDDADDELPSYLRPSKNSLFGGPSVTDDSQSNWSPRENTDLDEDEDDLDAEPESTMSTVLRGAWIVGQCIIAVAFGAGLFVAFDQLWKWNNIVALVLSVLVILGLVVGVRVVRKTEDIGSTLIAVAVGALVTLGPLALLQSN